MIKGLITSPYVLGWSIGFVMFWIAMGASIISNARL